MEKTKIAHSNVYPPSIYEKVEEDIVRGQVIVTVVSFVHFIHNIHKCPCKLEQDRVFQVIAVQSKMYKHVVTVSLSNFDKQQGRFHG